MMTLSFGEWLADRLDERDLQQQEFAVLAGVKPSTVSNWITGKAFPLESKCDAIADVLDLDPDEVRRMAGRRPQPKGRLREVRERQSSKEDRSQLRLMSEEGEDISLDEMREQLDRIERMLRQVLEREGDNHNSA